MQLLHPPGSDLRQFLAVSHLLKLVPLGSRANRANRATVVRKLEYYLGCCSKSLEPSEENQSQNKATPPVTMTLKKLFRLE